MTDLTLTCPNCRTEIKLTESLAAPLIADTRKRYETQLAQKEAEVAAREAAVRDQQEHVASARQAIDAEVASRLDRERGKIAVAEALKAKRLVETDLEARAKEIADLNEVLRQRDAKLAEAQQAQAAGLLDATQEQIHQREGTAPTRIIVYMDQCEELYTRATVRDPKDAQPSQN
jgi:hypothetical protein